MKIGIPRETAEHERRVAIVPETAGRLVKAGFEVVVEAGAGLASGFRDEDYAAAGAGLVTTAEAFGAELVLKVNPPSDGEITLVRERGTIVSLVWPHVHADLLAALAARSVSVFALERVPRITRAQSMDVLSSMSSLAGYRCVIEAARLLPKIFPLMMTAAGTIAPARVFVIGAGVAGLSAIATARRLGAVVEAFDVRSAAKEEVLSLGARFVQVELDTAELSGEGGYAKAQSEEFLTKQRALLAKTVAASDVVVTTALVPGRKAPVIVTGEMIDGMKPGSVVIDLAAEQGGNVEGSRAGETRVRSSVAIVGLKNVASDAAHHASQLFSRNIASFLSLVAPKGELVLDREDEIVKAMLVAHEGKVLA